MLAKYVHLMKHLVMFAVILLNLSLHLLIVHTISEMLNQCISVISQFGGQCPSLAREGTAGRARTSSLNTQIGLGFPTFPAYHLSSNKHLREKKTTTTNSIEHSCSAKEMTTNHRFIKPMAIDNICDLFHLKC